MRHFIRHCINQNMSHMLEHSYLNCHVEGLHSIMLCKDNIRMYIAEKGSKLHDKGFSLSIHPHRRNLTLHVIKGILVNETYSVTTTLGDTYKKYRYISKIKDGRMMFELAGNAKLSITDRKIMNVDGCVSMDAKVLHSVFCPEDVTTAWMVYEGKEDPNYESVCYNKDNPNKHNSDKLYQRPSMKELFDVLKLV